MKFVSFFLSIFSPGWPHWLMQLKNRLWIVLHWNPRIRALHVHLLRVKLKLATKTTFLLKSQKATRAITLQIIPIACMTLLSISIVWHFNFSTMHCIGCSNINCSIGLWIVQNMMLMDGISMAVHRLPRQATHSGFFSSIPPPLWQRKIVWFYFFKLNLNGLFSILQWWAGVKIECWTKIGRHQYRSSTRSTIAVSFIWSSRYVLFSIALREKKSTSIGFNFECVCVSLCVDLLLI